MNNLLGIKELEKDDILEILEQAKVYKLNPVVNEKKLKQIAGKTVIGAFCNLSTTEKLSYEIACKNLGLRYSEIEIDNDTVAGGLAKELIKKVDELEPYLLFINHANASAVKNISDDILASVVNAGSGFMESPVSSLIDLFTIQQRLERFDDLEIAILGDIMHSAVSYSNIYGLTKLGAKVRVCSPPTLMPKDINKLGVRVEYNKLKACKDCDVVYVAGIHNDSFKNKLIPSKKEYNDFFGLDEKTLKNAKSNCLIMSSLDITKGVEMDSEIYVEKSIMFEQVANSVAVKMALIEMLLNRRN